MLWGTYFILVEPMPGKYRNVFIFNFNCSVWMNTFCHTVCCKCIACLELNWIVSMFSFISLCIVHVKAVNRLQFETRTRLEPDIYF